MATRQLRGGQGKACALPNNMPFPSTSIRGRTHHSITLVAQTTRRYEVAWRTVAACALETWALFRRGPGRAKACTRAADPKSRALETDASRLNGRRHGAWGSSAVCLRRRGGQPESSILPDSDSRDMAWLVPLTTPVQGGLSVEKLPFWKIHRRGRVDSDNA
jgi:hypothetical protein